MNVQARVALSKIYKREEDFSDDLAEHPSIGRRETFHHSIA